MGKDNDVCVTPCLCCLGILGFAALSFFLINFYHANGPLPFVAIGTIIGVILIVMAYRKKMEKTTVQSQDNAVMTTHKRTQEVGIQPHNIQTLDDAHFTPASELKNSSLYVMDEYMKDLDRKWKEENKKRLKEERTEY
jgi:hypothetical protein